MDYIALGRRIRYKRQSIHLTQAQLAGQLGLSVSFLGHIERGTRKASMETLVTISNVLNISLDELLSESLEREIPQPAEDTEKQKRAVMRQIVKSINEHWDEWVQTDEES